MQQMRDIAAMRRLQVSCCACHATVAMGSVQQPRHSQGLICMHARHERGWVFMHNGTVVQVSAGMCIELLRPACAHALCSNTSGHHTCCHCPVRCPRMAARLRPCAKSAATGAARACYSTTSHTHSRSRCPSANQRWQQQWRSCAAGAPPQHPQPSAAKQGRMRRLPSSATGSRQQQQRQEPRTAGSAWDRWRHLSS